MDEQSPFLLRPAAASVVDSALPLRPSTLEAADAGPSSSGRQRAGDESLPWSSASENDSESGAESDSDPFGGGGLLGAEEELWAASASDGGGDGRDGAGAGVVWGWMEAPLLRERAGSRVLPSAGESSAGGGTVGGGVDAELQGMWGREMSPVLADLAAWPAPAPEPNPGQRREH